MARGRARSPSIAAGTGGRRLTTPPSGGHYHLTRDSLLPPGAGSTQSQRRTSSRYTHQPSPAADSPPHQTRQSQVTVRPHRSQLRRSNDKHSPTGLHISPPHTQTSHRHCPSRWTPGPPTGHSSPSAGLPAAASLLTPSNPPVRRSAAARRSPRRRREGGRPDSVRTTGNYWHPDLNYTPTDHRSVSQNGSTAP